MNMKGLKYNIQIEFDENDNIDDKPKLMKKVLAKVCSDMDEMFAAFQTKDKSIN